MTVVNVIGGGNQEWAVVELEAHAKCKNGKRDLPLLDQASMSVLSPPGMPYEQRYAWALRFDETGIVVQVSDRTTMQCCKLYQRPRG